MTLRSPAAVSKPVQTTTRRQHPPHSSLDDRALPKQTHIASTSQQKPKTTTTSLPNIAVNQLPSRPVRPPVRYNPRISRPPVSGGNARYPYHPAFVAQPENQPQGSTSSNRGGPRKTQTTFHLMKALEARAKDLARECIAQRKHVDSYRICQDLLRERNAKDFQALGLSNHLDIPYVMELERLQRRIYETITAYCQVRATCTLHELGKYLAQKEEKEDFEEVGLGPLLDQPVVYQYFKPSRTLVDVPDITTRDVLEYLRDYMDINYKWRGHIEVKDFLQYMVTERGCANPFELCVRVPSPGLSISVSHYQLPFHGRLIMCIYRCCLCVVGTEESAASRKRRVAPYSRRDCARNDGQDRTRIEIDRPATSRRHRQPAKPQRKIKNRRNCGAACGRNSPSRFHVPLSSRHVPSIRHNSDEKLFQLRSTKPVCEKVISARHLQGEARRSGRKLQTRARRNHGHSREGSRTGRRGGRGRKKGSRTCIR